jgi:hypothetical protein
MRSFQDALQKKLQGNPENEVSFGVDSATVLFLFQKVIEEEYGKAGQSNVLPEKFTDGTMFVRVMKSVWHTEVTLAKENLVKKINHLLGDRVVQELRVYRK